MKTNKYKVGDLVEIVGYGHHIWKHTPKGYTAEDIRPEYVGRTGIIKEVGSFINGYGNTVWRYSLDWAAWFIEDQLKLVCGIKENS